MNKPRWRPEEDSILREISARGGDLDEAAQKLPHRSRETITEHCAKIGILWRRSAWRRWEDDLIRRMHSEGALSKDVARALPHRSHAAVRLHSAKIGVHFRRPASSDMLTTEALALQALKGSATPLSQRELSRMLGVDRNTARLALTKLRGRGLAYIQGYTRSRTGPPSPLFAAGGKRDAPPLEPLTREAIDKRYYDRIKREEPEILILRAKRRSARKRAPRRDVASSWIPSATGPE